MANNNVFYDRIILLSNDLDVGINAPPPTTAQVIAAVFDPDNSTMVSSGLYTVAEANAKKQDAYDYFLETFGLDFLAGTPLGQGRYLAGGWVLYPYASGVSASSAIDVSYDSADRSKAKGKWRGFQFGQVLAATVNGSFVGGTHVGNTYVAGDVLAYFDYDMLKTNGGPISSAKGREDLIMRSPWTSKNILNSQGYTDSLSKLEVIDECGHLGFVMENIVWIKDEITDMVRTKTRVVCTWDKTKRCPCPCKHKNEHSHDSNEEHNNNI